MPVSSTRNTKSIAIRSGGSYTNARRRRSKKASVEKRLKCSGSFKLDVLLKVSRLRTDTSTEHTLAKHSPEVVNAKSSTRVIPSSEDNALGGENRTDEVHIRVIAHDDVVRSRPLIPFRASGRRLSQDLGQLQLGLA